MTFDIRPLTDEDAVASRALGREAFGEPAPWSDSTAPAPGVPGRTTWGVFDGDTLAARAARRAYSTYFGGAVIPTTGIAGVTVAAEYRGRGMLTPLLQRVLTGGRAAGDVISTLFASAPGIYRRYGFELIGSYDVVEIPTTAAAAVQTGSGITTRRATAADSGAIHGVYTRWARAQNGPLTRSGPSFPPTDVTEEFTGVTLAEGPDGEVLGYVTWTRGQGEAPDGVLEVDDLIATNADAYRVLWRVLGSFAPVLGRIRVRTSGTDVARLFLPPVDWKTLSINAYMLRLDDVAAAFTLRALPLAEPVSFAVAGDRLGVMDGRYLLSPGEAGATCRRVGDAGEETRVYTPGGIALAWTGAQSSANIRMAGGLTGGDATTDAALDRALGGWPLHVRDAF